MSKYNLTLLSLRDYHQEKAAGAIGENVTWHIEAADLLAATQVTLEALRAAETEAMKRLTATEAECDQARKELRQAVRDCGLVKCPKSGFQHQESGLWHRIRGWTLGMPLRCGQCGALLEKGQHPTQQEGGQ